MITEPSWDGVADRSRPRIGYAALCQAIPDCGRAVVARSLREGLGKVADVVDIWGTPPGREPACDAVLAMDCASPVPEPYFIYLCSERGSTALVDPALLEHAAGLFAENGHLAQFLADGAGIPREKIHVILPAVAARQDSLHIQRPHLHEAPRRKLLLCVRDYGGRLATADSVRLVLDVLDVLRREHDSRIRLTISGLESWSATGPVPDGVTFLAAQPAAETMALFDSHDLLVVSPGLGPAGLPEAFCRGIPCVATRASAVSEAITSGVTGAVTNSADVGEMAAAIASVMADDDIYRNCFERAPAMAAYFSWERVGRQVAHIISQELGRMRQRRYGFHGGI